MLSADCRVVFCPSQLTAFNIALHQAMKTALLDTRSDVYVYCPYTFFEELPWLLSFPPSDPMAEASKRISFCHASLEDMFDFLDLLQRKDVTRRPFFILCGISHLRSDEKVFGALLALTGAFDNVLWIDNQHFPWIRHYYRRKLCMVSVRGTEMRLDFGNRIELAHVQESMELALPDDTKLLG